MPIATQNPTSPLIAPIVAPMIIPKDVPRTMVVGSSLMLDRLSLSSMSFSPRSLTHNIFVSGQSIMIDGGITSGMTERAFKKLLWE